MEKYVQCVHFKYYAIPFIPKWRVIFCFEVDKNFYFWKLRPYKGVSFPFQQVFFVRREVRAYSINLWKYLQKESIDCEIKSS